MEHTRVVLLNARQAKKACRAFSDTTLVCFIVNEHTTKCSRYNHNDIHLDPPQFRHSIIHVDQAADFVHSDTSTPVRCDMHSDDTKSER